MAKNKQQMQKYLYAIAHADDDFVMGDILGIAGNPLELIQYTNIAALVSDYNDSKIRPERRHLMAHQQILQQFLGRRTILPVAFGTIVTNTKQLVKLLAAHDDTIKQHLAQLEGKVEMGLCVSLDVANVYDYFVQQCPQLKVMRDKLLASTQPRQEDKIEVGSLFSQVLEQERELATHKMQQILKPVTTEIASDKLHSEKEIMNLACLIHAQDNLKFEAVIAEAAQLFDDNFLIKYNGPWLPYHFVNLNF